jgi:hypothetical protein
MVKRYRALWAVMLVMGACPACKRGGSCTEAAARQGVIDYLSKRAGLNVAAMNVQVTSLTCREKDADATVAFTARGAAPGQPMSRRYTLERQGDHWTVKESADAGGSPHGASPPPGTELPAGHPAVGSGTPKQ